MTSYEDTEVDDMKENLSYAFIPKRVSDTSLPSNIDLLGKKAKKRHCNRQCCCAGIALALIGVVACVALALAACSVASRPSSAGESNVTSLRSEISELRASDSSYQAKTNHTLRKLSDEVFSLRDRINTLSDLLLGRVSSFPVSSCSHLPPSAPPGEYWVRAHNGSAVRVYCNLKRPSPSCHGGGGSSRDWVRVASLNFTDPATPCPPGFASAVLSGIRTCGIQSQAPACPSVPFETSGIRYSHVCGKVLAYQFGTPNAFLHAAGLTINQSYVDGVILTHGNNPRQHIWTFAAALDEYGKYEDGESVCECSHSERNGRPPPKFVGQDYFCDSGISRQFRETDRGRFFGGSPLWDGEGCGSSSTCCSFNNPPWFSKEIPPTIDPIDMRVCSQETRANEDLAMSSVEIYIHNAL